jgi:thioredoxin 1
MRLTWVAGIAIACCVLISGCRRDSQADTTTTKQSNSEAAAMTEETFESEIRNYKGVALVDFWAPWCGPCNAMSPVVNALAGEMNGTAKVVKVNVDKNKNLSQEFQITGIPCFVLMRDGKEIGRKSGGSSKEVLKMWIESASKSASR